MTGAQLVGGSKAGLYNIIQTAPSGIKSTIDLNPNELNVFKDHPKKEINNDALFNSSFIDFSSGVPDIDVNGLSGLSNMSSEKFVKDTTESTINRILFDYDIPGI